MKRKLSLSDGLFFLLVAAAFLPGARAVSSRTAFITVILTVEASFLWYRLRTKKKAAGDISIVVFGFLLLWEVTTTKLDLLSPILVPGPEAVFQVFPVQWETMLKGVFSSLELILWGFVAGLSASVSLGLFVGCIPRLRNLFLPIARVLSPIPPIICAPYIIALMPTFRSASLLVLVLGIFWPNFMKMAEQTGSMDPKLLDSARMMDLNLPTMVFRIYLPYLLPGLISGLKVMLSTSFLLLTMAEMMGAASGLGYYIRRNTDFANYTNVVAGIILVGVVITILNLGIGWIEKHLIRWRKG
ncbi:ABC transporter permease subunit [Cuneatibacter sp. NSJ-177]|uniref:ABC transporter permease n=1 Tax=Cuneatibacter sp. NSJ-177 TaxID=2931401 RepID=UPI001FD15D24|nr:ABC transporter permease subunit [Cuneatibacter sp. NSJ-177]MCJ7836323.1 ABC transporter permease subunit [Cuneatibacter sp. NSJ-177]